MAETRDSRAAKLLAVFTLSFVASYVVLVGIAMALYPGGTWCDRRAVGHRFWDNFMCDLLHTRALGGIENPGAGFARAGMLALVLGMWALILALPAEFPKRTSLARWLRVVGTLSVLGMASVPLLPSDRSPTLHGAAVLTAGAPGFTAGVLALDGQFSAGRRRLATLGGLMLAVSAIDMAIYARQYFAGGDCSVALPIIQRFAVGLVLAWMVASALALLGFAPAISPDESSDR